MPSSYSTTLGIELMVTGEKSGTWGDITNTNLNIVEQSQGYINKSIAGGAQTTALTITDGSTSTSDARNLIIELSGTITGNQIVTVPDDIEKSYIVYNNTTGAFTVEFKTVSGTGVTWGTTDKTTKLIYSDGTNVVDSGFVDNPITELVQDTSPQLGADLDTNSFDILFDDAKGIRDDSDNEQLIFQKNTTAVNYFEMTNAATGNNPALSVAGDDTNVGLNIATKGSGSVSVAANVSVTGNLIPGADDTYDLGTSTAVWQNIYTGDLHLSNKAKSEGNSVDGTKGNWTLQEGENDIYMINNISGEKFKIKMEKV